MVVVGPGVPVPGDELDPVFGAPGSAELFGVPGLSPIAIPAFAPLLLFGASLEVIVVELTCLLPEDRRPLVDPALTKHECHLQSRDHSAQLG